MRWWEWRTFTVGELIAELSAHPQDARVVVRTDEEIIDRISVYTEDGDPDTVRIYA